MPRTKIIKVTSIIPMNKDGNGENDAELVIGQYRDKNEFFPHKGLIDEVKIYDRALSEAMVVDLNMGSSGLSVEVRDKLATPWAKVKKLHI